MVHIVFLARDVPQEVFYVIAGILDTVALKRMASRAHGCHWEGTRSVVGVASRFDALLGGTREGARCQGDLRRGQDHGLLEKDAFTIFDKLPSCHEDEAILERTFTVQPFVVLKFSSQDRILQCTMEQISCDADRRTVGRSADERVPRQNPAADSGTDL